MTYTDFLSNQHTAAGHWNDAPSIINKTNTTNVYTKEQINKELQNRIPNTLDTMKIKDINNRLLYFSNCELSDSEINLCSQFLDNVVNGKWIEADKNIKDLMLDSKPGASKWIIGFKRVLDYIKV